jgi:hypothetical protein
LSDQKWGATIGRRYRGWFNGLGIAAVLVGALVVHERTRTVTPEELAQREEFRLDRAATDACETAVTRQLINSGSFDTAGNHRIRHTDKTLPGNTTIKVSRNFTAQNGFGATIDQRYFCVYDKAMNTVLELMIEEGFR